MFRRQQRLMVMRAMKVDQAIANLPEDSHGCLGAVDELPIGSGDRIDSLQQKLTIFARLNSLLFQKRMEPGNFINFKRGLNRALISASPNQSLIPAFSKHQFQRAENNRFPSPGFS